MATGQGPFVVGSAPQLPPMQPPPYEYNQPQPIFVQPVPQPPPQPPGVNVVITQPPAQPPAQQPAQQPVPQPVYLPQPHPQALTPGNQMVVMQPKLTETSKRTTCQNCQNNIMTQLSYNNGLLTWLICGGLFLIGFWPCMCIPFCVNSCKDVEHSCPNCGHVLHVHKQI